MVDVEVIEMIDMNLLGNMLIISGICAYLLVCILIIDTLIQAHKDRKNRRNNHDAKSN